jgi:bifunctional UDP-N-acetylglucosamine pyrophosphorylase/glucosamine-1-phosphate N-acetyltransferase
MQAVLLAAGEGVRLRPITEKIPKPMVEVSEKNLLERNMDLLPEEVDEVIMVVGYLKEVIKNYFGDSYGKGKIIYVEQKELLGTGKALYLCKDFLKDKFLVMMGDDIYSKEDIEKCLKNDWSILTQEVEGGVSGGAIKLDENENLKSIQEGFHQEKKVLVNTGLYVLQKEFFDYDLMPIKDGKEFGLPQTLVKVAQDYPVKVEKASFWLQVGDLAQLERAREVMA